MRRKRQVLAVLLFAAAAAIALVTAGSGAAGGRHAAVSGPSGYVGSGSPMVGSGGGFGESFTAPAPTLAHTLFQANLLPADKSARDVALAALGRSTKTVNYALALKCWKNNGCSTGTGGKLTVAYVEGFGENTYRQMSKMEFILQALTYPQVGKIIYRSAHSDLNQAIADFKSVIAQHVSAIVTYPDFGDAMLPVFEQATKAGIPVSTYAWGYVTGPGKNYLTVVGEDTCKLGKAFAQVMNTNVGSGDIAFLGGFPGNPLSLGWQKCEQAALNKSINVIANDPTN
jgi:ABC-type sugar transport system substrate-binding protein